MLQTPRQISFRVIEDSDKPFLLDVYADSRAREMQHSTWPAAQKRAFTDSQYELQDRSYKTNYLGAVFRIIELDGIPIGRLIVNRTDDVLHLIDLSILSVYQGRGIGSDILRSLMHEAQGGKVPMRLSAAQDNPAIALYQRLGFQQTQINGHYIAMEWSPDLRPAEL